MAEPRPPLVLASTSPYRRELLARLGLPFEVEAPEVDEAPLAGEAPEALVRRLSEAKARAVAARRPGAVVVGSDQVAVIDGEVLGKPGGPERAREQLRRASGRAVDFLTGLAVLDTRDGRLQLAVVPFRVVFRPLDEARIEAYLRHDEPWNCAGSFRSERLGVALFERMEGDDPTALMGLPLIRLVRMLEAVGLDP
ncbi:MAG TPA: septum formation inhibitor Maf, partial [Chromatiales bacterium]|nr:septum formation inhibitor Maf [Chromatiales bacterium]